MGCMCMECDFARIIEDEKGKRFAVCANRQSDNFLTEVSYAFSSCDVGVVDGYVLLLVSQHQAIQYLHHHLQCLLQVVLLNRLETQSAIQTSMLKSVQLTQVFLLVKMVQAISVVKISVL